MFIKLGAENTWDIYTYTFAFCASLAFYLYIRDGQRKNLYRMAILIFLSFLSKGPVGFYSLFIPFLLAHYIIFPKEIFKKRTFFVLLTLVISIALSLIWAFSMFFNHGDFFLSIVKDEVNAWATKHHRSFIFYTDYFVYMGSWLFFSIFVIFKIPEKKEEKVFWIWTILSFNFLYLLYK